MQQQQVEKDQLAYFKIGGIIRRYRKEKDLKLLDLAALTGIKSAMLSKIENGRVLPTIPTLFTIIQKLGVSPESFFAELSAQDKFPGYVFLPEKGFTAYENEEEAKGFEYFSILEHPLEAGAFRISLLNLKPDARRDKVTTDALEFIYVLQGDIIFRLEDKEFKMSAGDALFFDGSIAHVPVNQKKKMASLLVLYIFPGAKV